MGIPAQALNKVSEGSPHVLRLDRARRRRPGRQHPDGLGRAYRRLADPPRRRYPRCPLPHYACRRRLRRTRDLQCPPERPPAGIVPAGAPPRPGLADLRSVARAWTPLAGAGRRRGVPRPPVTPRRTTRMGSTWLPQAPGRLPRPRRSGAVTPPGPGWRDAVRGAVRPLCCGGWRPNRRIGWRPRPHCARRAESLAAPLSYGDCLPTRDPVLRVRALGLMFPSSARGRVPGWTKDAS